MRHSREGGNPVKTVHGEPVEPFIKFYFDEAFD
jgi:hypothetical protein